MIKNKKRRLDPVNVIINIFFILLCVLMLYPFWCIFVVSLTPSETITYEGFKIFPKSFDFSAYKYIFSNPGAILKAYGTTIMVTAIGTVIATMTSATYAYAIARKSFPLRNVLAFIATFTMFFSGGMASKYIINVSVLNLKNNIWVLILPLAFSAMNVIIMRSYFEQLPYSLIESAKLDGASEYGIFFRIMLPLSKPALATVALTMCVGYWNSYYEAMMYMDTGHYVTIQLMLQRMLARVDFVKDFASSGMLTQEVANLPSESLRMAMCSLTVIPMLLVFPRFQKFFVKGMAIGAVKE